MRYDLATMGIAQVASSIALDIIVLCFPLPIVFRMLLSPRKKFMVFFMFWLGALWVDPNKILFDRCFGSLTITAVALPPSSV